jgi:competence protein ComEA
MKRKNNFVLVNATLVVFALVITLILGAGAVAKAETSPNQININTADSGQLAALPGIGKSKVEAIVDYRIHHGPFPTIDSLTKVRGIGMKLVEKIRPFVTIQQQ